MTRRPKPRPATYQLRTGQTDPALIAEALAERRRWAVDELIRHPDVWARIAEHAERAARDARDAYSSDVFAILEGCARVLAAGPAPEAVEHYPQGEDRETSADDRETPDGATVPGSTTPPGLSHTEGRQPSIPTKPEGGQA